MGGDGKARKPIELRADRLRREAEARRRGQYELTQEQEIDLLGRVFAESVGHDLGFLCMLPEPAGKNKAVEDAKPVAKPENKSSDPPPPKPEDTSGWGNVTGHGC